MPPSERERPQTSNDASIRTQHGAIREEYRVQAESWGRRAIDEPLLWVVQQLDLDASWNVLDVAAGTGLFGQAVARHVASVTGVDLTPEMVARGRVQTEARGIRNLRFELGAAEQLPFRSDAFDAVITRYSVHHFHAPLVALREMARVCRTDGTLVIVDMVADERSPVARRQNDLERIADATHTAILSPSALVATVAAAGFTLTKYVSRDVDMVFEEWQPQLPMDSAQRQAIRSALERDLAGSEETGFRPYQPEGRLTFRHTWGVVVARKGRPASSDAITRR